MYAFCFSVWVLKNSVPMRKFYSIMCLTCQIFTYTWIIKKFFLKAIESAVLLRLAFRRRICKKVPVDQNSKIIPKFPMKVMIFFLPYKLEYGKYHPRKTIISHLSLSFFLFLLFFLFWVLYGGFQFFFYNK